MVDVPALDTVTMRKKMLIMGIKGQNDAYLVDFLLVKLYELRGIKGGFPLFNIGRMATSAGRPMNQAAVLSMHRDISGVMR